ncbi:MAG TPA: DUF4131 domain-containing protein, partial [Clostridiales bacterium]|nr:DUF4131 domain-containing protein [Clostridiales bacterium]
MEMRRPACIAVFAYILGCVLQYLFFIANRKVSSFVFAVVVFIFFFFAFRRKERLKILFLFFLFWTGMFLFKIHYEYNGRFEELFGVDVHGIGTVLEISEKDERMTQLTVRGEKIWKDPQKIYTIQDKMFMNIEGQVKNKKDLLGKRIRFHGELRQASPNRNPKMFNYQLYLKSRKIYGILYAKPHQMDVIGKGKIFFLKEWANRSKYFAENVFLSILPDSKARLLLGILFGDKNQMDPELYHSFQKTGTAHVLAVSGLHVGILYLFLDKLLNRCSGKIKLFFIV